MNTTFSSDFSSGVENRSVREPSTLDDTPVNITGHVMAFINSNHAPENRYASRSQPAKGNRRLNGAWKLFNVKMECQNPLALLAMVPVLEVVVRVTVELKPGQPVLLLAGFVVP
jgi:hypothetical protein